MPPATRHSLLAHPDWLRVNIDFRAGTGVGAATAFEAADGADGHIMVN